MQRPAMAAPPERIDGDGHEGERKPGLPGTQPSATEEERKGLLAAVGGFLLLLAVHPVTLAVAVGLVIWIVSRWL